MNTYNIVIRGADEVQQQFGVSASNWQSAINSAKGRVGLDANPETDVNLLIVQWTGKLDIVGQ